VPTTTHDGVRIHWQERGSGTPLLLVMGHLFPSELWYPVLPALSAAHRVILFDNRGTGDSDATDTATVSDLAGDARAVLDAAGVDAAHVFGVSMGGGVALQLAYESPERVRSLVLGCTAMKSATLDRGPLPGPFLGRLRYRIPVRFVRKRLRASLYGPIAPPEAVERDLDVIAKARWSPRGVYAQDIAVAGYDLTPDRIATIDVPALVLHGTVDKAVPHAEGEALAAALPSARLVTYDGAGHNFVVDCTERANADVLEFLRERDGLTTT
jgi:3-oxoadipate enol-lactonase